MKNKITIVGAGGWGTALAVLLSEKNNEVTLWCLEKETADEIAMNRTNSDFLPKIEIPNNVIPITDLNEIKYSDIIINTVPTQHIRAVYSKMDFSFKNKIFVNGAKGIEIKTLKRISEILIEVVDLDLNRYVVLSGPSHAEEVALGIPTAVLAASINIELAKEMQTFFSTNTFRVYSSCDIIGCELGGALKNVFSITSGILDGLELGDNSKAALITRGLAEMSRLGIAIGASPLTFSGLSGLGDLIVTCFSRHSRNRKVGELIGQGKSLDEVLKNNNKMIAEGVSTTESAYQLSKSLNVNMPITEHTYNILFNGVLAKDVTKMLMSRASKNEIW